MYEPKPIDTTNIELPEEILEIVETLFAPHNHDTWAVGKIKDGYVYGETTSDEAKTHKDLLPYPELPEPTKDYDRNTSIENLKLVYAAGYKIVKA